MTKLKILFAGFICLLIYSCTDSLVEDKEGVDSNTTELRASAVAVRRAPLYWSAYESSYIRDSYIPEEEWKENIDWVAENLCDYGYNIICIDGWGDVDRFNENGYRMSHSKEWKNDYAWWSDYLKKKGMTLGMYDNPLWVNCAAAEAGLRVKGTNIPISSLINTSENAKTFTWVQIDRPGAEQYVKGCIEHHAQIGVKYLRVDFLSWYETGMDKDTTIVGVTNRPRAHYETALRWMREECDRHGIFLSLVMPNLTNDGEFEAKYGDMIRVNEDCATGQWQRFSGMDRGIKYSSWSQYRNPMDGFTYFSKISGRDKVILDGDFIRINTYENDTEKKTVISMHLIAGGPVSIADRKTTIGNDLWLYRNEEMLALNKDGFVGKPLSGDPKKVESQIWYGQMSNGDYILALFNREDSLQNRTVHFSSIGMKNVAEVRDLWEHKDLGEMASYSVNLPPHGSVVLRLNPTETPLDSLISYWKDKNIGPVFFPGTVLYDRSAGKFNIEASGKDIEGGNDEFTFVYQEVENDMEISGRVISLDAINGWSKAGFMIRSGLTDNSNNALIAITPANGVSFQSRLVNGQGTSANVINGIHAEVWLKICRQDNSITAYYSKDNQNWTQIGNSITVSMAEKVYAGMAVTSHDANKVTKAVFQHVSIKKLPSPIFRNLEIGNVGIKGSLQSDDYSNRYTISASGADIEGVRDAFSFTYRRLSGNFTFVSQVMNLNNTNSWAKAGLMVRSELSDNVNNAMIALTPGHGLTFQSRLINGGGTSSFQTGIVDLPVWLKLVRSGNHITAYYSYNSINWVQVGTTLSMNLPETLYVGMAVTSHDNSRLTSATFQNVSLK